jgi:hypothetical protein
MVRPTPAVPATRAEECGGDATRTLPFLPTHARPAKGLCAGRIWVNASCVPVLAFYERFKQMIAHILSIVISVMTVVSLWQLIRAVIALLLSEALNPLDHAIFQAVFGMVMTLLIAMEFKHSITRVMLRRDHIVQVKTVILVAMLAIV